MADISETGSVFDTLAARQQRPDVLQRLRENDDDDDRRNTQRTSENDRSEETRSENTQRSGLAQQSNNEGVLSRIIDQNGNDVSSANDQSQNAVQVDQQRVSERESQREQRVEERRLQESVDRTEQRLQEQVAQERIQQSSQDPSLPRGSIVDISA